jgi:hypothetical protein
MKYVKSIYDFSHIGRMNVRYFDLRSTFESE